jgi:hypothetical protein
MFIVSLANSPCQRMFTGTFPESTGREVEFALSDCYLVLPGLTQAQHVLAFPHQLAGHVGGVLPPSGKGLAGVALR